MRFERAERFWFFANDNGGSPRRALRVRLSLPMTAEAISDIRALGRCTTHGDASRRSCSVYGIPRVAIKTTEPVMISELEFIRRG
jgi:hypothetical protein